jgi:hypothetical protein
MRHALPALFLLLVGGVSAGIQPAATDKSAVRWPEVAVPQPMPVPVLPVNTLPADQLYYVASDEDLVVLDSPEGKVKIVHKAGPLSIAGKFVDGSGRFEFRDFKEKNVFVVMPVEKGSVEILVVSKKDFSVQRKRLEVMGGNPSPPDPPVPPPDVLTQFQKDLQVAYDKETDKANLVAGLTKFYEKSLASVDGTDTWVGLFTSMTRHAQDLGTGGKYPKVQATIGAELSKTFPTGQISPTLALTAAEKVKVKATFKTVMEALSKLK